MSRLILLGSPGTKRTSYFMKGAARAGADVELLDWEDFPQGLWERVPEGERAFLKIDPPQWGSCCRGELDGLVREYEGKLKELEAFGRGRELCFLNAPDGIRALLDKRRCKRRLLQAGIPVTEEVEPWEEEKDRPADDMGKYPLLGRLMETMAKRRIFQVFIKPNFGSGAAGVMALRYEPARGEMALYTCGMEETGTGRLVNTKRLRRFTDRERIGSLTERLLELDCIVERWYPKAEHEGFSYDLRAVVQDGETDFILARLSKGPVTNLHLNNHPLKARNLGLPSQVTESVEDICRRAAACYPALRSVGIDVLLERGSLRPRIIEMNGQGDLIYQDIYGENRIYTKQARMMRQWIMQNV